MPCVDGMYYTTASMLCSCTGLPLNVWGLRLEGLLHCGLRCLAPWQLSLPGFNRGAQLQPLASCMGPSLGPIAPCKWPSSTWPHSWTYGAVAPPLDVPRSCARPA